MIKLNGIIVIFLLAFAVSIFVYITQLFKENKPIEIKEYKVKVSEVTIYSKDS